MSSKNNSQIHIPEARNAMDQFKMLICPGGWRPDGEEDVSRTNCEMDPK